MNATNPFNSLQDSAPDPGRSMSGAGQGDVTLDLIMDVGVNVTLEVGRTRLAVRDLLQLTQGAILELDPLAGEPPDVLVKGVCVARGEGGVVNGRFGVRLTEVISPRERMERVK